MSGPLNHAPADQQTADKYPFAPAGTAEELYPPVCLRTHWDPTQILKRVLPEQGKGASLPLPLDFRPYVRICKDYVTTAPAEVAPMPPASVVFPQGGEFYPPGRYSAAIDRESVLRYLDRRLDRWCQTKEYVPPVNSDMYNAKQLVPRDATPVSGFVAELAMPQTVLRDGPYDCRSENDATAWNRSPRLFNNPTKQDKWGSETWYALPTGKIPMPHGNTMKVPPTAQTVAGAFPIGRPGGDGVAHAGIQPIYGRGGMARQPEDRVWPLEPVGVVGAGVGSKAPA